MSMTRLTGSAVPAARFDGLITTESDDEVIVYDEMAKHIHHLNRASAVVWRLCDGRRSVSNITAAATDQLGTEVSEDVVRLALHKLDDAKLLDGSLCADIRGDAQSRRSFLMKAAVATTLPVVVSISAPYAASAVSTCTQGTGNGCGTGVYFFGKCCSGGYCSAPGTCSPFD